MILDFKHTTKDGKTMLVSQMDTDHLLNMINLMLKKANDIYVASKQSVDPYKASLYGVKSIPPESAAAMVDSILDRAAPYIIEAFFRYDELSNHKEVMNHIKEMMQSVLQRAGKLEQFNVTALPAYIDQDEIDDEILDEFGGPDESEF